MLVSQEQKLGTRGHLALLEHSPGLNTEKPLVGPFLSPKNLNLASFRLYMRVLLANAFAVHVNGYCYFFSEISCISKSFQVVNIKNAGFSKLETRFSCFKT